MFIVFNKQKIYSYLIALSTVVVLFIFAFSITSSTKNTIQTSTNIEKNNNSNVITNQVKNNINNTQITK